MVLGAPTAEVVPLFHTACERNAGMRLVVCASLPAYNRAMREPEPNLYSLPTNCRANHGLAGVVMGNETIRDAASWRRAQTETSVALRDLFLAAQTLGVPTYFAIVERALRSTCVALKDGAAVFSATNDRDGTALPNADEDLTNLVLGELVADRAAFAAAMAAVTGGTRRDGTAWHSTYLADVLTVACAGLLGDETAWSRFSLGPNTVAGDGTFPAKGVVGAAQTGVAYWKGTFSADADGLFRAFRPESVPAANACLRAWLGSVDPDHRLVPIWQDCVVWHDALLNDVDDRPAIELVSRLGRSVVCYQNFTLSV